MDKLKNVFHRSSAQDEQKHYESEQNIGGKTGAFKGEGSHLVSSRGDVPGLAGSQTADTYDTSGPGSASTGIPSKASVAADQPRQPLSSEETSGLIGHGSRLVQATSGHTTGSTGNQALRLGNTSQASAALGNTTSGFGSTSTSSATGPSTLAKDAAMTAAATIPGDTGFAHHGFQSGSRRKLGTENAIAPSQRAENPTSTTNLHMPGAWDDSFDQSRKNSYIGSSQPTELDSSTGTSAYPSASQGTTQLVSTPDSPLAPKSVASGYPTQSSSGSISKTVSSIIPSTAVSTSHLGRDAAALRTAGAASEDIHYHREDRSTDPTPTADSYPNIAQGGIQAKSSTAMGRGRPERDDVTNQSVLGTATLLGTTTSHSTTLPSGSSIPSSAAVTQNPHYSAGLPDRSFGSQPSSTTVYDSQQPTSTTDDGMQRSSSTAAYGSENPETTTSDKHWGRDAAVAGGAGVLGGAALHHNQNQQNLRGQYTSSSNTQPDVGNEYTGTSREFPLISNARSTGFSPTTQGPITSSKYSDTSSSQPDGSEAGYAVTHIDDTSAHHGARDAAALSTAGAVRGDIHHERASGSSGVTSSTQSHGSSLGPHITGTANLLDPSVSSGTSKLENASHHDPHHGGGAEEADKHHSPKETSSKSHHYGRNTAIGAGGVGAAGLVAHEHYNHEKEKPTGVGNTASSANLSATSSSTTNPTNGSKFTSETGTGSNCGNQNTNTASATDPYSSTATSKDHQYGHDGGVGSSVVSFPSHAEHENEKHPGDDSTGSKAISQSLFPGPGPNTEGPHSKDWMNKLDPRVDANPTTAQESHQDTPIVSGQEPSAHAAEYKAKSTFTGKDPYYGDAAMGGGGIGAAELARREYEKHRAGNTQGVSSTAGTSQPTSIGYGTGSNTPGYGSQQPTSSTTSDSQQRDSTSGNHYGRDATVVAGVGVAGYEAGKHLGKHSDQSQTGKSMPTATAGTTTTSLTHENDNFGLPSKTTPKFENQHHIAGYQDRATTQQSEGHYYETDAAVVGGVGGATYEAEHYKHDKDLTHAERDAKKQQKHDEKEAKKEHKHEEAHKEKKGGLLSFLHRDKNKKYTPEEEAEFDREGRDQDTSHASRDAALGTAGVGAVGLGAYEAEKHYNGQTASSTDKTLPHTPIDQGLGSGTDTSEVIAGGSTTGQQSSHHYGRDASLGAGAADAAGYAAHEHNKYQGAMPHAEKPADSDVGAGVLTGASGLESHVHSEATTDQYGNPIGSGVHHKTGSQPQGQHRLRRDAEIGVGAAGAAGIVAHEHRKHDSGYQNTLSPTSQQFDEKTVDTSSLTSSPQTSGNNAATIGKSGGAVEHEHRKYDTTSSLKSGSRSDTHDNTSADYGQQNAGSGYSGSDNTTDPSDDGRFARKVAVGEDGRKRLHKDPPANHPAAV